ncbi:MAG: type III toxin-antitoxin system ToxN/AbiQ family toxin [Bacilli bacterium]|nr:type III toxin-antitoxin system ToxN/AbiQ family toxin [Bacilli bacterium]
MKEKLIIVRVSSDYCDFLRQFDNKVAFNMNKKELRPFIGILFIVNNFEYFAPLSSPKIKHLKMKNTIDFIRIKEGKLGAVNFNNMIPVTSNNYTLVELSQKKSLTYSESRYRYMLEYQLNWLNEHIDQIHNKSFNLYSKYVDDKLLPAIRNRCCNFILLEEKCKEYNQPR